MGAYTKEQETELRVGLLNAQFDLSQHTNRCLILVIAGDDQLGCEQVIDRLHEWLDARQIDLAVLPTKRTKAEKEHPFLWRYWRELPCKGRTGIFFGGWQIKVLTDVIRGKGKHKRDRRIEHFQTLERLLTDDGAEILKLWITLPRDEHEKRHALAEANNASPLIDLDRKFLKHIDDAMAIVDEFLQRSATDVSKWVRIDGTDASERDFTVGGELLAAYERLLTRGDGPRTELPAPLPSIPDALDSVDLSATIDSDAYKQRLAELQSRLTGLAREAAERGASSVLVFEGWDAAGKGGSIRRVTKAIRARDVKVVPIAAPTREEHRYHYLWRFWQQLPRAGRMTIFDRSWYGRVLVERVEGFARESEWRRAYDEIRDFEEQLVEEGVFLAKFWLHIDRAEQLERFKAREQTPYKKYKITSEDYRNRDQWQAYVDAVNEMVAETSTAAAPWTLVPANDKRVARIRVLETVCDGLARVLQR